MAASSSCNSIGAAIDKLNVDCIKGIKGTSGHGGHLISISPLMPNNNQASRFASIAVAATAWAGFSMCPVDALAIAYDGDHRNAGDHSVFNMSTSMLQLSDEKDAMHMLNAEMEAIIGNAPSIKPPNEGLNSPWLPKIDGLKKKDTNTRSSMRCPKWTESELEMVLPDFQGRPKPFPRKQGHLYPFWPATTSTNNKGDDRNYENSIQQKSPLIVIKSAASSPDESAHDIHDRKTLPSSPAPPPQQLHMPIKKPSCFTM